MTSSNSDKVRKVEKKLKQFFCPWCEIYFEQYVRFAEGNVDPMVKNSKGKKSSLSDQAKCPQCGNCVPTWERKYGVKMR